jgi:DNA polymerase-1
MLHKLIRDEQPELLAVVMDAPGKTFRDELYAEYKANRPPMPDDLRQQVEPLTEAIEALGLPLIRIAGVEADDVIGTLATQAAQGKLSTVISTGDKDMAQLVSERITLLDTMPRGTSREPRAMDAAGVLEKFQVRADQIVDYLALVGDSSDNIPGVPKVGAKTAVALLAEFDSVDDILTNLDAVAELPIRGAKGLAERIAANSDVLQLSRRLATIKCDVVLDRTPDELVPVAPDLNKLRELYRRLELNRLLKTLPEEQATTTAPENTIYETILSDTQLDEWLVKIEAAELVAFDTETTSIDYI